VEDFLSLGYDTITLGDMNFKCKVVILVTENAMLCCPSLTISSVMSILVVVQLPTVMTI